MSDGLISISAAHYRELADELAQAQSIINMLDATLKQMQEDHAVAWPIARVALAVINGIAGPIDLVPYVDALTPAQCARLRGTA